MPSYRSCKVCDSVDRYDIELAYMTGDRTYPFPFSRSVIEAHIAHVTEPEALRLALGMSAPVALAARLRYLEAQALQILDASMAGENPNPALALKAMREVRATIELMGRVAGSLVERVEIGTARPDLDAAIESALRAKGNLDDRGEEREPGPRQHEEIRALPAPREEREPGPHDSGEA